MTSPTQQPPAATHSRRATGYLFLGLLASLMPMPFNLVALVPLGAAIYESVRLMRELHSDRAPRGLRVWAGVGLALTMALLISIVVPYLLYATTRDYNDCLAGANTQVAEQACEQRYR